MQCSYLEAIPFHQFPLTPESPTSTSSHVAAPTAGAVPTPGANLETPPPTPTPPQSQYQYDVNMQHMELLGHFLTTTLYSLGDAIPHSTPTDIISKYVYTTPYLMHEILAFAASHLSQQRHSRRKFYQDASADLLTRALSLFNAETPDIHAGNCVPKFLFSSLLAIHVFFTTMSTSLSDADLLNKFIADLDIHRGVRAITGASWRMLKETELQPILRDAEIALQPRAGECRECDALTALLDSSDLSPASLKECRDALDHLRSLFQAQQRQDDNQDLGVLFAWPITLSGDYTKLLLKRQPEALIILAYYAVLILQYRRIWIIGDAGPALIRSITAYLGTFWEQWLAWPNEMLNMDNGN